MRVAVPLFGDEVSPRFGCSARFLVATVENGRIVDQQVHDASHLAPWQLPGFVATLGVSKVICGGVHRTFQAEMENLGLEVIWGVIGPAAAALAALANGTLQRDQFVCPGRRRHRGGGWGPRRPANQGAPGRGRPGRGQHHGPM